MAELGEWLEAATRNGFRWGVNDCFLWPADWVLVCRWIDPAAGFRGRYSTALGAERLLLRSGGPLALASAQMAAAGLQRVQAPLAGDVGVIEAPTHRGLRPVGAIFTGRRWATLTRTGLALFEARPMAAWRP